MDMPNVKHSQPFVAAASGKRTSPLLINHESVAAFANSFL
ncbi:hypothetical protein H8958_017374, partial [Nasalis larvatus]